MIYFIKSPRIDEFIDLRIVITGKKSVDVTLKPEQCADRINQESCRYWTDYLKRLLLDHWEIEDIKRRSQIITSLYHSGNISATVKILINEIPYLLSIEQKDADTTNHLQECSRWLKSLENSPILKSTNVNEIKNNSVTFENEPNRPTIDDFLNNFNKR